MSFTSFEFIFSSLLLILFYYVLPKKVQWVVLLAASLGFYLTWGWEALPFMLGSALIAWLGTRQIFSQYQQTKHRDVAKKKAKPYLILTLIGLLAM